MEVPFAILFLDFSSFFPGISRHFSGSETQHIDEAAI